MKKYAFIFVNALCLFSLFIHAKDKQISKFGEQSICDVLENIENKKIKQSVEAFISKDSILANIISESKNEHEILSLIKILTKDYDADVNAKNNYGQTALHIAVAKGYAKIVQELLNLDADINIKNLDGKTPLMVAENSDIVELLINNGATIPSDYVYPIFLLAIAENNIKIIKFLLSKKVDVNKQDFNDTPLLIYAASVGNTQIINLLLEHGAIIDALNDNGETALMWAAYQNRIEAIKLLLEKKSEYSYPKSQWRYCFNGS